MQQLKATASVIMIASTMAASAMTGEAAATGQDGSLDRDFRTMMDWFPGRYDNQEQVYFERELNVPQEDRHQRVHHIFFPADLDGFPGKTFYIQQYQHDDPGDIYRQRIYAFEPDYGEGAIRLTIYTPKEPEALVDAHLSPSKLKGLSLNDVIARPGCEVFWKREAAQFVGYMKEDACSFVSPRSGERITINDDLHLSRDEIWINDRATGEDGARAFGNRAGVPYKNRKARLFDCWVSVKKRRGEEWSFDPGLKVHDQGGQAWVETDERRPQRVGVKIRNVVWPEGRNRNSLVLYAYRDGESKAASYAWTAPEGERIALNLRWMQASCTLSDEQPF